MAGLVMPSETGFVDLLVCLFPPVLPATAFPPIPLPAYSGAIINY